MLKPVEDLMKKEVSRKEFIALVGLGLATLVGLSHIIEFLSGRQNRPKRINGYSTGTYGGK